jgi:hypothetical protein
MAATISLRDLVDEQPAGARALLAAEILQKTGRTGGPSDDRCEICHMIAHEFTLLDWVNWHCPECVERSFAGSNSHGEK